MTFEDDPHAENVNSSNYLLLFIKQRFVEEFKTTYNKANQVGGSVDLAGLLYENYDIYDNST